MKVQMFLGSGGPKELGKVQNAMNAWFAENPQAEFVTALESVVRDGIFSDALVLTVFYNEYSNGEETGLSLWRNR